MEACTLVLTMHDSYTGLEIELIYTVFTHCNVVCRRTLIRNKTGTLVRLKKLCSATLDLHTADLHLLHLAGSWAAERLVVRVSVRSWTGMV